LREGECRTWAESSDSARGSIMRNCRESIMKSRLMNVSIHSGVFSAALLLVIFLIASASADADDLDQVEKILGAKGQVQEGALILRFPRTDISVSIDGDPLPISLGFVSWVAWKNMGDQTLVMGDLVLLENEVNPVISALEEVKIGVAALHNHFMRERPRVMFIHVEGMGKGAELARGLKNALAKTATPQQLAPESPQAPVSLDTRRIEDIIGYSGTNAGGVFKITVGRPGVISHGMELTSSLGMNSWAGFVGTNERAHVAGDMAMTAPEVNRVIRALRNGGIEIVAVHNHMLDEQPRMFFLHYWGSGRAENLAQTVRSALDQIQGPVQ